MNKRYLTWAEVDHAALIMSRKMEESGARIFYGIPRGGEIALRLAAITFSHNFRVTNNPADAEAFVDDIEDSGKTKETFLAKYPTAEFFSMFTRMPSEPYIVFPWENDTAANGEDIVRRQLQLIGENPNREGLLKTPERVVRSWKELFKGYNEQPSEILNSALFHSDNTELVLVKRIKLYTTCEHHLQAIIGWASVAYIPNGKVVGLSKLARVVDAFARRLQIQENLTEQIADCIDITLKPHGVAVQIAAEHLCMCARGVNKQDSVTVTSALRGAFKTDATLRTEFYQLIKG